MEETVGASGNSFVTINTAWTDNADGSGELTVLGMHVLHDTCLNTRGVRAEQNVLSYIIRMLTNEECVLHVTGWMISSKVHLCKDVQIILYFRTVCQHESHTTEDVDNLVGDNSQRVTCAQLNGLGCASKVNGLIARFL